METDGYVAYRTDGRHKNDYRRRMQRSASPRRRSSVIDVPSALAHRIERLAADNDSSVDNIVRLALEAYLADEKPANENGEAA